MVKKYSSYFSIKYPPVKLCQECSLQILAKDNPKLKQSAIKVDDGVMSLSKMFDALYSAIANDELSNQIYDKDFSFQEMIDLEIALAKSSISTNLDITVNVELDDKIPKKSEVTHCRKGDFLI